MSRHYLPTGDGKIVSTVGELAIVLPLDRVLSDYLPFVERMAEGAPQSLPALADYWTKNLTDLRWAVTQAEANFEAYERDRSASRLRVMGGRR